MSVQYFLRSVGSFCQNAPTPTACVSFFLAQMTDQDIRQEAVRLLLAELEYRYPRVKDNVKLAMHNVQHCREALTMLQFVNIFGCIRYIANIKSTKQSVVIEMAKLLVGDSPSRSEVYVMCALCFGKPEVYCQKLANAVLHLHDCKYMSITPWLTPENFRNVAHNKVHTMLVPYASRKVAHAIFPQLLQSGRLLSEKIMRMVTDDAQRLDLRNVDLDAYIQEPRNASSHIFRLTECRRRQRNYYRRFLPLICRILSRLPLALLSLVTRRILYP
jgi:hypothetical protein